MANETLVYSLTNLSFGHKNSDERFNNLSFDVRVGEKVALIGPNGAGKSTLLNLMSGYQKATQGRIEFMGKDLLEMSHRERAQSFTYLPQSGKDLGVDLRLREFVEMGLFSEQGRFEHISEKQKRRIEKAIESFELGSLKERSVATLSGGEFQRARLARSIARLPKIYLFDEPAAALDIKFQLKLWQEVQSWDEATLIAAVHDIDIASRVFDRVLVFNASGELVANTTNLTCEVLEKAFEVGVEKAEFDRKTHWFFRSKS